MTYTYLHEFQIHKLRTSSQRRCVSISRHLRWKDVSFEQSSRTTRGEHEGFGEHAERFVLLNIDELRRDDSVVFDHEFVQHGILTKVYVQSFEPSQECLVYLHGGLWSNVTSPRVNRSVRQELIYFAILRFHERNIQIQKILQRVCTLSSQDLRQVVI